MSWRRRRKPKAAIVPDWRIDVLEELRRKMDAAQAAGDVEEVAHLAAASVAIASVGTPYDRAHFDELDYDPFTFKSRRF